MMTVQDGEARELLGFVEAVVEHIAPLVAAQGFACVEATPYVVKFESPKMVLKMSHDRLSYEMETSFVRKPDGQRRYTVRDMLAAELGPAHKERDFFQASQPDAVAHTVKAVAKLLERYGKRVLAGEPEVYERMTIAARTRDEALTNEIVQGPTSRDAEEAWRRRDYALVRDLYERIEADLTHIERAKLKFAKDH
jgi:hypothetical protein